MTGQQMNAFLAYFIYIFTGLILFEKKTKTYILTHYEPLK